LNERANERDLERLFGEYGKIREVMMKNGYAFLDFDDRRDAEDACYDLNGKEFLGDRMLVEHAKGAERGVGGRPLTEGGYRGSGGSGGGGFRGRDRGYGNRGYHDRGSYNREDRFGNNGFSDSIAIRKQHARDKYGPPIRTKWQVKIENLSSRVSWQDLKDYVRPFAEVAFAEAHKDENGVGILCLASKDDLNKVIHKMDGAELNGKKVIVTDETDKSLSKSRSRSPRKHRSKSRSRSRSRSKESRSKSKSRSRSKSPGRSPRRVSRSPNKSGSRKQSRYRSRSVS